MGIALLAYALACFLHVASAPYTGLYSYTGSDVAFVEAGSPAERAGIRAGDRLVAIGPPPGRPANHYYDLSAGLEPGGTVVVHLSRPGEPQKPPEILSIPVHRRPFPTFFFLTLILVAGLWALAFALYAGRAHDPAAKLLYLLVLASLGTAYGSFYWYEIRTRIALGLLVVAWAGALPPLTLHFDLVFPERRRLLRQRWWPYLIYGPAVPLFLVESGLASIDLYDYARGHRSPFVHQMWIGTLCLHFLYFATTLYVVARNQVRAYRTSQSAEVRAQIRWLRLGAFWALIPFLVCLTLAARDFGALVMGAFRPWFLSSVILLLGTAMLSVRRHRLGDVDVIFKRTMLYLLLHAFLIALCLGNAFWLPSLASGVAAIPAWLLSLVALFVLIVPIRNRLLDVIDRRFALGRFRYEQALAGVSEVALGECDLKTMVRRLIEDILPRLDLRFLGVLLRTPPVLLLSGSDGARTREIALAPDHPLIAHDLAASLRDHAPAPLEMPPAGDDLPLHLALPRPLTYQSQAMGLLLVGPRRDGLAFQPWDKGHLGTIANQISAALHTAIRYEEMHILNLELEAKIRTVEEQKHQILVLQERLQDENRRMREEMIGGPTPARILGSSPAIERLRDQVRRVGPTNSTVLITGESGTGKELVARALHESSPRRDHVFLAVSVAALPLDLIESELFGYERGAFTGAVQTRAGKFELAHGGTIFLDEIGELSLQAQVRLLRVLQERELVRLGGTRPVPLDVRVLAATNRDMEEAVSRNRFREDLFFRLNVIRLRTPPLRDRTEDVFEISLHILEKKSRETGKRILRIEPDALLMMQKYRWPGNVRELENVLERALVLGEGDVLTPRLLSGVLPAGAAAVSGPRPGMEEAPFPETGTYEECERLLLLNALRRADFNKSRAATLLGLRRTTFLQKLKRFRVEERGPDSSVG